MILTDLALKNRMTVMMIVLAIIVAGSIAYLTLPREAAPDVEIPYIIVTTTQDGVSPEDIENTITHEIEQELSGLKGMKEFTSTSAEGISQIVVEFLPDVEIEDALQRVKDKVDLAQRDLPVEADEPIVSEINFAELPIMLVTISGPISPVRLKTIAEELEDRIEVIPGVLGVDLYGDLEREIRIEIDPDRVAAYGLTIEELLALIPSENVNVSAGGLETRGTKFNVRVPAEFERPEQVGHLKLTVRDGRPIYLADVATVADTFKDRQTFSRLDGDPSITIAVRKRVGQNIVEIADTVKALLAGARRQVPESVELTAVLDESKDIRNIVRDLENNILTALILVVGVLLIFMGALSSLIVALAIPLSMLMSFAILQALDVTLNMVVLFSLILALGMLVDNAIVIVENIYRFREQGNSRLRAAMLGAREVAWPVIASTATTLGAFAPMLFWPGIMGEFMKYLPMTVIVVLSSSLFVALVISPVVCSVLLRRVRQRPPEKRESRFVRAYRRLLGGALGDTRHQVTTILVAVSVLVLVAMVFVKRGRGLELFPETDPREATINIRAPQGTSVYETDRLAREIERRVEAFRENPDANVDNIDHVVANIGSSGDGFPGEDESGPHVGDVKLIFPDFEDRPLKSEEVMRRIRPVLGDIAGAEINLEKREEGPPTGDAVTVRIIGRDLKVLERLSDDVKQRIADVPNLVNLRSDLERARPELSFRVDRERAMLLGVNTRIVGEFLKTAVLGTQVGTFREFEDDYDITIRLPESQRVDIRDLLRLHVPNIHGRSVPLSSLGRFAYSPGLGTIHRLNQKRLVTVTADAEGRSGPEVLADAQAALEPLVAELPGGYEIQYAGENEESEKATAFLSKAMVFAMLLIVGILVAQFNTFSVPLIIASTVVLSTVGVLVGLLVMDLRFGLIMTGVGVISLAGVVVNNAIVLLDFTRQLQMRGLGVVEAAVEAGVTRLRPVLLTATTTILGLLPMVTGVSMDFFQGRIIPESETSQWWGSMATAVVFGLAFATVLTLVVVPCFYVLLYRVLSSMGLGGLEGHQAALEELREQAAPAAGAAPDA
jgi:multidrug efflux pump subunit AcrB